MAAKAQRHFLWLVLLLAHVHLPATLYPDSRPVLG